MKYCSSCKSIMDNEAQECSLCKGALCELTEEAIVTVALIKGTAVKLLEPALKDAGIPCVFENTDGNVYNEYNFKVSAESDYKLLVPFEMYNKAFNVCEGFGFVNPEDRLIPEDAQSDDGDKRTYNEKFEAKTGVRHQTWQTISIILFIIAACLVIWGIDFVAEYIKGLFIK